MRKLLILLFVCFTNFLSFAGGIEYFNHVKSLYNSGRYEEALQGFKSCKTVYHSEFNTDQINNINIWISKCQTKISEKKAIIQAKRKAEVAAAQRRAHEAKLAKEKKEKEARLAEEQRIKDSIQQERIKRKLLFVSSNAFLIDCEYTGMHQAIKEHIANNSDYRFTDNPDNAYWSVYVTANAYPIYKNKEENKEENKGPFHSRAIAYIKIIDEINNETIYEGEIESSIGDYFDYNNAARKAYTYKRNGLNIKTATEILKHLK